MKRVGEVVAAETALKLSCQTNGFAAPAAVWSVPQERLPLVSAFTSQLAEVSVETLSPPLAMLSPPEMLEVETAESVSTPALDREKSEVVAVCVEDAIRKRLFPGYRVPLLAWTESAANGVVVPTPRRPAEVIVVVPVAPK